GGRATSLPKRNCLVPVSAGARTAAIAPGPARAGVVAWLSDNDFVAKCVVGCSADDAGEFNNEGRGSVRGGKSGDGINPCVRHRADRRSNAYHVSHEIEADPGGAHGAGGTGLGKWMGCP